MRFEIRPATRSDAVSMVDLLNPIIEAGNQTVMDQQVTFEDQASFISQFPSQGIFLVAVAVGGYELFGMQDVIPHPSNSGPLTGEISTFVSQERQGLGVGRALMMQTLEFAKAKGYQKLIATIRMDNNLAQAYYRAQGFKVVGRTSKPGGKGEIEQIVTELELGQ